MDNKYWISSIIIISFLFSTCQLGVCATMEFDEKGIPIVNYGYVSPKGDSSASEMMGWTYLGKQRSPLAVSSQGIIYYDQYLKGNSSSKDLLLNCANWLIDNVDTRNGTPVWEYDYGWPTYRNSPHFISGMAQSAAIRVLAMAYNLTGEEKYIQTAKDALNAFYIEVNHGGVAYKDVDGLWYEEYAEPGLRIEPRVLNGHMAVLIDLHDYYNFTRDGRAKELIDLGIRDLKSQLQHYDIGIWSMYDRAGHMASLGYHELHIKQLEKIYSLTGDKYFMKMKFLWVKYKLVVLQNSV